MAATIGGNMIVESIHEARKRLPRKRTRARAYAVGSARITVRIVEATATITLCTISGKNAWEPAVCPPKTAA
jgi:hypothetical protein